mmetsp:Transcript_11959/g.33551  ORF Transcript_11959/g.33551 Transcript_11959/m.33551 type:complete len:168 (+) Transcript_11959:109-612(+)
MMKALRAPVPASAALQDHHSVSFSRAGVPAVVTPVGFDDSYAASTPAAWLHAGEFPHEPMRVRLVGVGLPLPREEEVPWPRRLAQAACFEQGSGSGSELRSLELGVPTRTQRRRMQRRTKKTMDRQVVSEQSHGAPSLERPPGVFAQPAARAHAWPCQFAALFRVHL